MTSIVPRSRRLASAGYTLFEIMLVLGIIAVLVGSAIYLLVGNLEVAKISRVDADFQAISTQLRTYEMQNMRMPTTAQGLEALVKRPSGEPAPRRWIQLLESAPLDPWGEKYIYANPGKLNPRGFDLVSKGPDRVEGGGDDITNKKSSDN
ncbi:MAG: type II secretion system major pseudopilin GspG [Chthoniobacterales bacterium]